jgi:hypothetical protein
MSYFKEENGYESDETDKAQNNSGQESFSDFSVES